MSIKTIVTIALVNFAVVVGMIFGWSFLSKKEEIRIPSQSLPTISLEGVPSDLLPQVIEPISQGISSNTATTPVAQPTLSQPADTLSNHCIVTVQGKRYDVTRLRITHSGGDIFTCGTDMTNTFFSQHDQRLLDRKMQQYLVL